MLSEFEQAYVRNTPRREASGDDSILCSQASPRRAGWYRASFGERNMSRWAPGLG